MRNYLKRPSSPLLRTLRFCVLFLGVGCLSQAGAKPEALINNSLGNGSFEQIDPSDAPLINQVRRASDKKKSFRIPGWKITSERGFGGIDGSIQAFQGNSYAFTNTGGILTYESDPISGAHLQTGQILKLTLHASDRRDNRRANYHVSFLLDGEELRLPPQVITVPKANEYVAVEFSEQLRKKITHLAVKITLDNHSNRANGQQPHFDQVTLSTEVPTTPQNTSKKFYVARSGNDQNPGSIKQPFRTIQQAANIAKYGDTIFIGRGTYREKITLRNSGLPSMPIRFQRYENQKVTISTADLITGWKRQIGDINQDGKPDSNVWLASATWDAGGKSKYNTLFVDGELRIEAHEQAENDFMDFTDWGQIEKGNFKPTGFISKDLAGWKDDFWVGAKVRNHTSDWSYADSTIADYHSETGGIIYEKELSYYSHQKQNWGFYLFDTIKALNRPHEWFKKEGNKDIYYMAESGVNPNSLEIELNHRDATIELNGVRHVELVGLHHRGGGIRSQKPASHILIKDSVFYGDGKSGRGYTDLNGSHYRIENNIFKQNYRHALKLSGQRFEIINNHFSEVGYEMTFPAIEIGGDSSEFQVSYNTFTNIARGCLRDYPERSIYSYNVFEKYCRLSWDTAALDGDNGGGEGGGTLVHHNIFRDAPIFGSGFAGVYSGRDLMLYRNIFYHVGHVPITNARLRFHFFFHNTIIGGAPDSDQEISVNNSEYSNNIQLSTGDFLAPGLKMQGNHNYNANDFIDYNGGDLRLKASSPAIDKGILIPGLNDQFTGSAPDAGALEFGEKMWPVGYAANRQENISYHYDPPLALFNLYDNGIFAKSDEEDWKLHHAGLYLGNTWNAGFAGFAPNGAFSLKVKPKGHAARTISGLKPNTTYRILAEARLVNELIDIEKYAHSKGDFKKSYARSEFHLHDLDEGEWLRYDGIEFGNGELYDRAELVFARQQRLTREEADANHMELRLGSATGPIVAKFPLHTGVEGTWGRSIVSLSSFPTGQASLYLIAKGEITASIQLAAIRFLKNTYPIDSKLRMGARHHGYPDEFSFIGQSRWSRNLNSFEGLQVKTGPQHTELEVFFENHGPYNAYVDRLNITEASQAHNIADQATLQMSSEKVEGSSSNLIDSLGRDTSASTTAEHHPHILLTLEKPSFLNKLKFSASEDHAPLQNLQISLWASKPAPDATPLFQKNILNEGSAIGPNQSFTLSIQQWLKEDNSLLQMPKVQFIKIQRLDSKPLALSDIQAFPLRENLASEAIVEKSPDFIRHTFNFKTNPTHITIINGHNRKLNGIRVTVKSADNEIAWEKKFSGKSFELQPGSSLEIPGNEIGDDGMTRLASSLGIRIDVERIGLEKLDLQEVRIYDGRTWVPKGNLALKGETTQSGNHYKDMRGFSNLATNGYIFPRGDFSSSLRSPNPFWEIKLEADSSIEQIVLFNRTHAAKRIGNFKVSVLDAAREQIWSNDYSYQKGDLPADGKLTINQSLNNARYLRVQTTAHREVMSLAEVQIWGK